VVWLRCGRLDAVSVSTEKWPQKRNISGLPAKSRQVASHPAQPISRHYAVIGDLSCLVVNLREADCTAAPELGNFRVRRDSPAIQRQALLAPSLPNTATQAWSRVLADE
jgi:hypothetical protein